MAMSICKSFKSTARAGLGIRPPHWAVSVRDPKAVLKRLQGFRPYHRQPV